MTNPRVTSIANCTIKNGDQATATQPDGVVQCQ